MQHSLNYSLHGQMAKPMQPAAPLYIGATGYRGELISKCRFDQNSNKIMSAVLQGRNPDNNYVATLVETMSS